MIEDTDGNKEHLHILLTSPTQDDEVITACICTRHSRSETLVCVAAGEHPFVKHPSIVAYAFAEIRKCKDVENAIKAGKARPQKKASEALLKKMKAGLLDSDFTPNGVRAFFKSCQKA
jgi:hypothetical protein